MLNVISIIPPSLEKFLGEFKNLFIEPQFKNFKVYPFGLQLELKRTNIQTINIIEEESYSGWEIGTFFEEKNWVEHYNFVHFSMEKVKLTIKR